MMMKRAKNIKFDELSAREKKFNFQNLKGRKPFLNIEIIKNIMKGETRKL